MDEVVTKQPTNGGLLTDPDEIEKREQQRKLKENLERAVSLFRDDDLELTLNGIVFTHETINSEHASNKRYLLILKIKMTNLILNMRIPKAV